MGSQPRRGGPSRAAAAIPGPGPDNRFSGGRNRDAAEHSHSGSRRTRPGREEVPAPHLAGPEELQALRDHPGQGLLDLGRQGQEIPRPDVPAHQRQRRPPAPQDRAGDQGPGRPAVLHRPRHGQRPAGRARPAAGQGHPGRPDQELPGHRRRDRQRERPEDRPRLHRATEGDLPLPRLSRRHLRGQLRVRRPPPAGGRAGRARLDPRLGRQLLPLLLQDEVPGVRLLLRGGHPGGDRGGRAGDGRRHHGRAGHRQQLPHHPAGRLHAAAAQGLRRLRDAADRRRGDDRLRAHRQVVRLRALERHPRHHDPLQGHQQRLPAAGRGGHRRPRSPPTSRRTSWWPA